MDAAVERTGMYSQRVPKVYDSQLTHALVISLQSVDPESIKCLRLKR
jgi:hypothetical protein